MTYQERVAQAQRLLLLQVLAQDSDYRVNDSMLQAALDSCGQSLSLDKVRTELRWLAEQTLITLESVQTLRIATLTRRGLDVAEGRAKNDGVARPLPE